MMLFLFYCISFLRIKNIEESSFNLETPISFGSGNFISLDGRDFAVTAYHNLNEDINIHSYLDDEVEIKNVAFLDPERDIAIFNIDSVKKSLSYKPHKKLKEGLEVHYWCSAGEKSKKYYKGYISKVYIDKIIVQGFAWMGCSGGLVFDKENGLIGLVSAIAIRSANENKYFLLENEVSVSLIRKEDFYGG